MHKQIKKLLAALFILGYLANASAQNTSNSVAGVYSSPYGTFTIGLDKNGTLKGCYDYFDHWDAELKAYMRQNTFTMSGTSKDGKTFDVLVIADPYPDDPAHGKLIFKEGSLTLTLPESAFVDAAFEISDKDGHNTFPLLEKRPYTAIKSVRAEPGKKSHKAVLFDLNGTTFTPKKAYLLQGDLVYCLESNQKYTHVVYQNWMTGKQADYWIQTDELVPFNGVEK